jgi:acetylornithine/N-succinyldiaminopimelate aminotransferase
MVEPVQGEGGMRSADIQFMRDLRAMCDEFGLIMALDEVQCGMGRTGKLFAHEWAGIEPDVISAAKGIGGGFPLGAVLAKEWVGKHLVPGTHGTTYGGNPLACTAGNAVLDVLLAPGFLDGVIAKGEAMTAGVQKLIAEFPGIFAESRGRGLMQGIKCVIPAGQVQAAFTGAGLMTVTAGENVVRLVPPLVVTEADIAEAIGMMRRAASDLASAPKAAAQ